jgi:hypothetical protein
MKGGKPLSRGLRLVSGNAGKRPLPAAETEVVARGRPRKPTKLQGRAAELWDEVLARTDWLAEADSYLLHIWVQLMAEFERAPDKMVAARLTQLRLAGASLGLDPTTRPRLVSTPPPATDPADRFLGAQHTHLR